MVSKDRLWNRLMELGKIGRQSTGGVIRLSYTQEENQAKELVATFMEEAGLSVSEDSIGNLIGRREGTNPDAPSVVIGSHVDSVIHGGDFDGPLGVLSGIEVVQAMNEQGIWTDSPIEVIAFTDEEGARFRFGMIGSRAFAGSLTEEHLQSRDADGVTIAQAMTEAGYSPNRIKEAARGQGSVKCYVEVHIEQGKVLETAGQSVGVVTGIAGPLWMRFKVSGEAGHAGTTPMGIRHDALVGSTFIIQTIEEEASKYPRTVGTVGQLNISPGGVNIIPGQVEFTADLRDVDEAVRDEVEAAILQRASDICTDRGLQLEVDVLQRVAPVHCSEKIQEASFAACRQVGIETQALGSGAGHDGMQFKDLWPVGMIFVRSKDGISHQPEEWSSLEDCADGARVLYHTILRLANESDE